MPEPIDSQLVLLEQSLRHPRAPFSTMYDRLVREYNLKLEKGEGEGKYADEFKVLEQLLPPGQSVFQAAFAQAKSQNWLDELCLQLTSAGGLEAANDAAANELNVELQSVVRPMLGLSGNYAMTRGGLTALRRVCRVVVEHEGGTSSGTGFLVGPQAILTSWHVISSLLDGAGAPIKDSEKCITVQFDHVGAVYETLEVKVAELWLVASSAYHPTESPHHAPVDFEKNPPEGFDQYLDYAGIRLNQAVGRLRGYYQLDPEHKPRISPVGSHLTLYQHPAGDKMYTAMGYGVELWPADHQTRLRHTVNALKGSSGGLIVDSSYKPVALHQCGIVKGDESVNGAIPTACIAAKSGKIFEGVLGLDPVWRTLHHQDPILGRREFQQAVQNCMLGALRIIAVVGQKVDGQGVVSGKSFSLEILNALLRDSAEHSIIAFKSAEIGNDPRAFAEEVIRRAGAEDPTVEPLPEVGEGDTAIDAWVRGILFPAFARRLTAAAAPRQLWLVIDNLDVHPLAPGALQHFLEQIYQDVSLIPALRIVLLGAKIIVPGARPAQLYTETISPISRDDLIEYLQLYATEHMLEMGKEEIERLAIIIEKSVPLIEEPAVKAFSRYIQQFVHPALKPL